MSGPPNPGRHGATSEPVASGATLPGPAGAPRRDRPPFPGGTSVSQLCVYDWPALDLGEGPGSGTPHLHTVSAEGYVVLAGAGSVQTLGGDGFAEHALRPGTVVWFEPGVVHRLVNEGGLELVVVMSNAGLPEAGDAVLTFPAEVLADPEAYARAAALPEAGAAGGSDLGGTDPGGSVVGPSEGAGSGVGGTDLRHPGPAPEADDDATIAEAARRRRDLALTGYAELRRRVEREGPAGLADLHAAAVRLVRPRVTDWRRIVAAGVEASTASTLAALDGLEAGQPDHLAGATVAAQGPRPGPRRYGMCGRLRTWELG